MCKQFIDVRACHVAVAIYPVHEHRVINVFLAARVTLLCGVRGKANFRVMKMKQIDELSILIKFEFNRYRN